MNETKPSATPAPNAEAVIKALRELADGYIVIDGEKHQLGIHGRTAREAVVADALARRTPSHVAATQEHGSSATSGASAGPESAAAPANEQDRDNKVGQWWCTHCRNWVPGQHVTYQENHDPREGGCGSRCTETAPSSIEARKHAANIRGHVLWLREKYPHAEVIPSDLLAAADFIDGAAVSAMVPIAAVDAIRRAWADFLNGIEVHPGSTAEAELRAVDEAFENAYRATTESGAAK